MKKIKDYFVLLGRSFSFLKAEKKKYLIGVCLSLLELLILFVSPYVNRILIDLASGNYSMEIWKSILLCFLPLLLMVPLVVIGKYMQASTSARGTANLRIQLMDHLLKLPYSQIKEHQIGDYITLLTDDVNRATSILNSFAFTNLLRFMFVFPIAFVWLALLDWRIAIISLIYGVINLLCSVYLNPYAKKLEREAKGAVINSSSFLFETIKSVPIIRIFALEYIFTERYSRICEIIKDKHIKYRTVIGITYGVVDFFAQSSQVIGFLLGFAVSGFNYKISRIVFNSTLMGLIGDSIYRLSTFILLVQPSFVAMDRVYNILELQEENYENTSIGFQLPDITVNKCSKAIEVKNISFSHHEEPFIRNLSFSVDVGEHIALVGSSGGGKTTLANLIVGLLSPSLGEILYFGKKGSDFSKKQVSELIAYVPQECLLFEGTIKENIAAGDKNTSFEDIVRAAQKAHAHEFIMKLEDQYNYVLGDGGIGLSGGEKQRIAIARALLKDAQILVLDEPTAALDPENEKGIANYLSSLGKNITTITIAHRLNTVKNAHRIIVIENGQIVQEGPFEELSKIPGPFKELYNSQDNQSKE